MAQSLGSLALLVRDYDEAIDYYCNCLGFDLVEDTPMTEEKRWVRVKPPGATETHLLLAKAATEDQRSTIGKQGGGRVFLFLHTDDFWRDYEAMRTKGVRFMEEPRKEVYGTVAVFCDCYGNSWDLLELSASE